MHYSRCNCYTGNDRADRCYGYSIQAHLGLIILSVGLGILSVVLLYLLFEGILNKAFTCFNNKTEPIKDSTHTCGDVVTVSEIDNEEDKTGKQEDDGSGRFRRTHCWACAVKDMSRRKNSKAPFHWGHSHRH